MLALALTLVRTLAIAVPAPSDGAFTIAEDATLKEQLVAADADGHALVYRLASRPQRGAQARHRVRERRHALVHVSARSELSRQPRFHVRRRTQGRDARREGCGRRARRSAPRR